MLLRKVILPVFMLVSVCVTNRMQASTHEKPFFGHAQCAQLDPNSSLLGLQQPCGLVAVKVRIGSEEKIPKAHRLLAQLQNEAAKCIMDYNIGLQKLATTNLDMNALLTVHRDILVAQQDYHFYLGEIQKTSEFIESNGIETYFQKNKD